MIVSGDAQLAPPGSNAHPEELFDLLQVGIGLTEKEVRQPLIIGHKPPVGILYTQKISFNALTRVSPEVTW